MIKILKNFTKPLLCIFRRPHRHKGCRKSQNSIGGVFAMNDMTMVSDYKSRFGQFHYVAPVDAIRPMQRPRDPNPPPMDLRTENQMAYKAFDNVDRMKPCKVSKKLFNNPTNFASNINATIPF